MIQRIDLNVFEDPNKALIKNKFRFIIFILKILPIF